MAQLAIKGHPTRGKEVIEILEMLGGNNVDHYSGFDASWHYTIVNNKIVWGYLCAQKSNFIIFTLEEFLEKFPYKVGDKVVYKYDKKTYFIRKMFWGNGKILYELSDEIYSDGCSMPDTLIFDVDAVKLQPYKEETMEIPEKLMPKIDFNEYCKDKYILDLGNYEIKEENGKTYAVRKWLEYPKTYDECCKIMGIEYPVVGGKPDGLSASTYRIDEIRPFIYLLICRDAYWKIAGDWKPYWSIYDHKFCIGTDKDKVIEECVTTGNRILAFPTKEMRDAFYENFKELIEQCKELL